MIIFNTLELFKKQNNKSKFLMFLIVLFSLFMTTLPAAAEGSGSVGSDGSLNFAYNMGNVTMAYSSHGDWNIAGGSLISRSTKHGVPAYTTADTFIMDGQELVYIGGVNPREYRTKIESFTKVLYHSPADPAGSYWEVLKKDGSNATYSTRVFKDDNLPADGAYEWYLTEVVSLGGFSTVNYKYTKKTGYQDLAKIISGRTGCGPNGYVTTLVNYEAKPESLNFRGKMKISTNTRAVEVKHLTGTDSGGNGGYLQNRWTISYVENRQAKSIVDSITMYGTNGITPLPPEKYSYKNIDDPAEHFTKLTPTAPEYQDWMRFDMGCILYPGDYDGDGLMDYIRQEKGGFDTDDLDTFLVYYSNGDGTFTRTTPTATNTAANALPGSTDSLDAFQHYLKFDGSGDNEGCNIIPGDFNGDGKTDFLRQAKGEWPNANAVFHVFLSGDTKGSFEIIAPTGSGGDAVKFQQQLKDFSTSSDEGCNIIPGDFDGDGKTDFIRQEKGSWADDSIGSFRVYYSNGDGTFTIAEPSAPGALPDGQGGLLPYDAYQYYLKAMGTTDKGGCNILPGDYNGDGKTDFLRQEEGAWADDYTASFQVYFSNGTQDGTFNYITPTADGALPNETGGFFPGDAYQEYLKGQGDTEKWGCNILPTDINGDGMMDFFRQESGANDGDTLGTFQMFFSKGDGTFSIATQAGEKYQDWLRSDPGANIIPGDFNGDGKGDFLRQETGDWATLAGNSFQLYIGEGNGNFQIIKPSDDMSWMTFNNANLITGDFNGDGAGDFLHQPKAEGSTDDEKFNVYLSNYKPILLESVKRSGGGKINYSYNMVDRGANPDIPFNYRVVDSVTVSDGFGNDLTTTYKFEEGVFNRHDKSFRGFGKKTVTGPTGDYSVAYMHTDADMKSIPYQSDSYNAAGVLFGRSRTKYIKVDTDSTINPAGSSYWIKKLYDLKEIYDGQAVPTKILVTYEYDEAGNVISTMNYGKVQVNDVFPPAGTINEVDVSFPDLDSTNFTDIDTDKSEITFSFRNDTVIWFLGVPLNKYEFAANQDNQLEVEALTRYVYEYDGEYHYSSGKLLHEAVWDGAYWRTSKKYEYDAYGNVTATYGFGQASRSPETALANTVEYDEVFRSYPVVKRDTEGNIQEITYDNLMRPIRVLSNNGMLHSTVYDNFSRPISTTAYDTVGKKEYGSSGTTFTDAVTDDEGTIIYPASVVHSAYETADSGESIKTYTFFDGMGRTIQTKSETEKANEFLTVDRFYSVDTMYHRSVQKSSIPYITGTLNFTARDTTKAFTKTESWLNSSATGVSGVMTMTTAPDGKTSTKVKRQLLTRQYFHDTLSLETITDGQGKPRQVKEFDNNANFYASTTYENTITTNDENRTELIDSNGNISTYPDYCLLDKTIDAKGNVTRKWYNRIGQLMKKDDPDLGTWYFYYDYNGHKTVTRDAKGQVIRYEYDAIGRVKTEIYPDTTENVTYVYKDAPESPGNGLLESVTYKDGQDVYTYNAVGEVTQVTRTIDGKSWTMSYEYDYMGRISKTTYPDGEEVISTYDSIGALETHTGLSPYIKGTSINHSPTNDMGREETVTFGNDVVTTHRYKKNTFLLDSISTSGNVNLNLSYGYDSRYNITSINDTGVYQNFTYDGMERVNSAYSNSYSAFNFQYDTIGNIENINSSIYSYDPDHAHGVQQTAYYTYEYDANGNMTKRTPLDNGTSDPAELAAKWKLDLQSDISLYAMIPDDSGNWKQGQFLGASYTGSAQAAAGAVGNAMNFSGDDYVRVHMDVPENNFAIECWIATTESDVGIFSVTAGEHGVNGHDRDFYLNSSGNACFYVAPGHSWDTGKKLNDGQWHHIILTVEDSVGHQIYIDGVLSSTHNVAGSTFTQQDSFEFGYSAEAVNPYFKGIIDEVAIYREPLSAQDIQAMYGNASPEPEVFTYDYNDRLTMVKEGEEVRMSASYDSSGRRIKKEEEGIVTYYPFAAYQEKWQSTNKIDTVKYYFEEGRRIAMRDNSGLYYLHMNHVDSLVRVSDDEGNTVRTITYTPYGEVADAPGTGPMPAYLYQGEEFDSSTGLYYVKARYYDPALGRFITADTVNPRGTPSQSLNRYAYAANNPVMYLDPSGHSFISSAWNSIKNTGNSFYSSVLKPAASWSYKRVLKPTGKWIGHHASQLGAIAAGAGMIAGGVALDILTCGAAAELAGGLIGAGVGGIMYTATHFNNFNWGHWGLMTGTGFITGFLTAGVGEIAEGIGSTAGSIAFESGAGAGIGAADGYVSNGIETGHWTGKDAAMAAGMGALMGGVSGTIGGATKSFRLCFVKGTLVVTEKGLQPIESILTGDKVWSYNEKTGKKELNTVVQLFRNKKENLVTIHLPGESITATKEHPFYVNGKWVTAGSLKEGDILTPLNGKKIKVIKVEHKQKMTTVYNFEVEKAHTYYVGKAQVLVHNVCDSDIDFNGVQDAADFRGRLPAGHSGDSWVGGPGKLSGEKYSWSTDEGTSWEAEFHEPDTINAKAGVNAKNNWIYRVKRRLSGKQQPWLYMDGTDGLFKLGLKTANSSHIPFLNQPLIP